MAARKQLSFATCNLFNINEPHLPMYRDAEGWTQEQYDNSRKRIWAFVGSEVMNDHLNWDNQKETGTTDHGIVKATFEFRPVKT